MIRRAYLVDPPPDAADVTHEFIGGLPNLLRQVLSLQDAGIETVTLIGLSTGSRQYDLRRPVLDTREHFGASAFGAGVGPRADENRGTPAPVEERHPATEGDALIARAGCVWHPKVVRRLARRPIAAGEVVAVGAGDAAVYLRQGSNR
jgi:hypothetical protein